MSPMKNLYTVYLKRTYFEKIEVFADSEDEMIRLVSKREGEIKFAAQDGIRILSFLEEKPYEKVRGRIDKKSGD